MLKNLKERKLHLLILTFLTGLFFGVNLSNFSNAKENVHKYLDYFHQVYQIVRTDFVEEYPELSRQVIDILNRAAEEVNKDPDANRKYLPTYTPLNEELAKKVPILYFIDAEDITEEDSKALQVFLDLFTKYGAVEGKINVSGLLYSE